MARHTHPSSLRLSGQSVRDVCARLECATFGGQRESHSSFVRHREMSATYIYIALEAPQRKRQRGREKERGGSGSIR